MLHDQFMVLGSTRMYSSDRIGKYAPADVVGFSQGVHWGIHRKEYATIMACGVFTFWMGDSVLTRIPLRRLPDISPLSDRRCWCEDGRKALRLRGAERIELSFVDGSDNPGAEPGEKQTFYKWDEFRGISTIDIYAVEPRDLLSKKLQGEP